MEICSLFHFISFIIVGLFPTDLFCENSNLNSNGSKALVPVEMTTTTTTTTTTREPPIKASICPTASTILPCTCSLMLLHQIRISIQCNGSGVDQGSVETAFRELRRVNGIPEDRGVEITTFRLAETELTEFDLAPLYGSQMELLDIVFNGNLTKFVTSGNSADFHGSIHVYRFMFWYAPINRQGFGDALKYFSNQMTQFYAVELDLSIHNNKNNNNMNMTDEGEFLPGLSAFVNLSSLTLAICNISGALTSSYFSHFSRLQAIDLSVNQIQGIGEHVFPPRLYSIDLRNNKLNESSFHPNSGINQNGNGVRKKLHLESNQIRTLPSEIFGNFLSAHPDNILWLNGNPIICDDRLNWIKSQPDEFRCRLSDIQCTNGGCNIGHMKEPPWLEF